MDIQYNILTLDEPIDANITNLADQGECCAACRLLEQCVRYEFVPAAPGFVSSCDLFFTAYTAPTFPGTSIRGTGEPQTRDRSSRVTAAAQCRLPATGRRHNGPAVLCSHASELVPPTRVPAPVSNPAIATKPPTEPAADQPPAAQPFTAASASRPATSHSSAPR